jgi:hypothetical protein
LIKVPNANNEIDAGKIKVTMVGKFINLSNIHFVNYGNGTDSLDNGKRFEELVGILSICYKNKSSYCSLSNYNPSSLSLNSTQINITGIHTTTKHINTTSIVPQKNLYDFPIPSAAIDEGQP